MTHLEKTLLKSILEIHVYFLKISVTHNSEVLLNVMARMTYPIVLIIKEDKVDEFAYLLMDVNTSIEQLVDFVENNRKENEYAG